MASACVIVRRGISTSSVCHGKRNFRKFLLYNKRGNRSFKEAQAKNPDPDIPIDKRGVRDTGLKVDGKFVGIPEMIPELIVPSLKNFPLKPYVSYKSDMVQRAFTPKDLFDAVYADKIKKDFNSGELGPNGEPLNPSDYEKLTAQEAKDLAGKTGSDIFCQIMQPEDTKSDN